METRRRMLCKSGRRGSNFARIRMDVVMSTITLVRELKRLQRARSVRGQRQREFLAKWIEEELDRRVVVARLFVCRTGL